MKAGCLLVLAVAGSGLAVLWNVPWTIGVSAFFLIVFLASFCLGKGRGLISPLTFLLLNKSNGDGSWTRMLKVRCESEGEPYHECDVELIVPARNKSQLNRYQKNCRFRARGGWAQTPPGGVPLFVARKHHRLEDNPHSRD